MAHTFKNWENNDIYDFYIEFNRIGSYNEYCKQWLAYYNIGIEFDNNKTDWTINDIVDIKDYNRLKSNINVILDVIKSNSNRLAISTQYNQVWNVNKANEIEEKLKEYLTFLGDMQFAYNISGLSTTGNDLKLNGVM